MTTAEYLATLKKLGLSPHSKATAWALGVSPRMARYYAAGRPLPRLAVVRLLRRLRRIEQLEQIKQRRYHEPYAVRTIPAGPLEIVPDNPAKDD